MHYCCCFATQQQRENSISTVEGFCEEMRNGTWGNRDSFDSNTSRWWSCIQRLNCFATKDFVIEKQTNQLHTALLTATNLQAHQVQQNNRQPAGFTSNTRNNNAQKNNIFRSSFTRQNPLDTTNGKHRRKWYGKHNKN